MSRKRTLRAADFHVRHAGVPVCNTGLMHSGAWKSHCSFFERQRDQAEKLIAEANAKGYNFYIVEGECPLAESFGCPPKEEL